MISVIEDDTSKKLDTLLRANPDHLKFGRDGIRVKQFILQQMSPMVCMNAVSISLKRQRSLRTGQGCHFV